MIVGRTLATAISGLNATALRVSVSASNIVNQNTPGFKAKEVHTVTINTGPFSGGGSGVVAQIVGAGEGVDLALEFTRLIEAEVAYKAGIKIIQTAEEMEREAVNIVT